MNELNSMWRTELWHPLLVHLPLATLLLASVAGLFRYFIGNKERKKVAIQLTWVLLIIGVASGWLGIYTGELAYNIEVRKICDPKALQEHQWWSYCTVIIYSVLLALYLIQEKFKLHNLKKLFTIIYILMYIAGLGTIVYAGHLGAKVVYEQGAGVYKPKDDCSDYIVE